MSLFAGVFQHFACKNQLPGFSMSGTLAKNGLKKLVQHIIDH